jgi:probable rRNA maturation factor
MPDDSPTRSLACDVTVLAGDWLGRLPDAEHAVNRAVRAAMTGVPADALPEGDLEIGIALADDDTVRALNRDYRGRDKPTNVLSFAEADAEMPAVPGAPAHVGDIVLALETVLAEAGAQAKVPGDHLVHLTVHGVLHLLGYDHERGDAEAHKMEALEIAILAGLGIADPYADGPAGHVESPGSAP